MSASSGSKAAGYTLSVYTIQPIEPTATRQGKKRSRTKTEWAVSWNIETTTPHLYIVNERYNSRSQRASKKKKRNSKQTTTTTTTPLSEKKEEAGNVSEQRVKGWIHVIRVHDTTHFKPTATRQGKRQNERSRETSTPPPLTCTS